MKKILISVIAILTVLVIVGFTVNTKSDKINVASLDGQVITKLDLENHIQNVLGESYRKNLETEDGLKKLAGYYIDRKLLLEYARQEIKKGNKIVANHTARKIDEETMLVTALLAKEVSDNIEIEKDEITKAMSEKGYKSEALALDALKSEVRKKRYFTLMDKVRKGHEIKFF